MRRQSLEGGDKTRGEKATLKTFRKILIIPIISVLVSTILHYQRTGPVLGFIYDNLGVLLMIEIINISLHDVTIDWYSIYEYTL